MRVPLLTAFFSALRAPGASRGLRASATNGAAQLTTQSHGNLTVPVRWTPRSCPAGKGSAQDNVHP
eukprot:6997022-Pyramimonas_sp.AAC.1